MKCATCKDTLWRKTLKLIGTNGRIVASSFCCYDCYLKFWKNTPGFIPLPEYKKGGENE